MIVNGGHDKVRFKIVSHVDLDKTQNRDTMYSIYPQFSQFSDVARVF